MPDERIAPPRQRQRRSGLPVGDPRHGTKSSYTNYGCRCDACREANTAKQLEWGHRSGRHRPQAVVSAERRAAAEARDNHGTEQRYKIGCRCDVCREGARVARARRRSRLR